MSRFRPVVALLAVLLSGAVLVSGCGLRTPNGVRVDQRSVDTALDDPDIRKLPPGPASGASPAQIVSGFLEAAAADPEHTIADDFLANSVTWTDQNAVTVYDPQSLSVPKVTGSGALRRVELTAQGLGQVGSGGAYLPYARPIKVTFELAHRAGQWRLTYVPAGVLLTPRDLARGYRAVRTYSYDPSRSLLVPEPGYVVSDRAGLAGATLHALLTNWGGEGRSASDPFQSLAPGLTALGSVVVRDGEATVDLGREAFNVPPAKRHLLVEQIAASLGSVPGVFMVRVLVEEREYVGGAVPATIPPQLTPGSNGATLAIAPDGALIRLGSTTNASVATAIRWSARTSGGRLAPTILRDPVASPGGARFAAWGITGGVSRLVVADFSGGKQSAALERRSPVIPSTPTTHFLTPQWLDGDRLLLASTGTSGSRVQLADVMTGAVTTISTPGLAGLGPLTSLVVSRDRSRVIAVAGRPGARVAYLGRVEGSPTRQDGVQGVSVDGWAPVATSLQDVEAVSWSADLSITVLGRAAIAQPGRVPSIAARRSVVMVALDTVADPVLLPALPPPFAVAAAPAVAAFPIPTVASAPGRSTLIGIGPSTWVLQGSRWQAVTARIPGSSRAAVAVSQVSYP